MGTQSRQYSSISIEDVQPGDLATHVGGHLDPRIVGRVHPLAFDPSEGNPKGVWLKASSESLIGPFPAENYSYKRAVTA